MDALTIIKQAQSYLISASEATRELEANNIHGAFNALGGYCGFDYTHQQWIAVNPDGSTY